MDFRRCAPGSETLEGGSSEGREEERRRERKKGRKWRKKEREGGSKKGTDEGNLAVGVIQPPIVRQRQRIPARRDTEIISIIGHASEPNRSQSSSIRIGRGTSANPCVITAWMESMRLGIPASIRANLIPAQARRQVTSTSEAS